MGLNSIWSSTKACNVWRCSSSKDAERPASSVDPGSAEPSERDGSQVAGATDGSAQLCGHSRVTRMHSNTAHESVRHSPAALMFA